MNIIPFGRLIFSNRVADGYETRSRVAFSVLSIALLLKQPKGTIICSFCLCLAGSASNFENNELIAKHVIVPGKAPNLSRLPL